MADTDSPSADVLLRLCADADPAAWYPSAYAKITGVDRDALDDPLNRLRMAGLLRLTDWQPGVGQGYVLTEAGRSVADSPRALAKLRNGRYPTAAAEAVADDLPRARTLIWERGETVRDALLTSVPGPVTKGLMAAQILVFVVGLYLAQRNLIPVEQYLTTGRSPTSTWMAVSADALSHGQWWRLVSYAFVHGGAMHLVFNLIGHYAFGPVAERMFGPVRYLVLWLLGAVGGGCGAVMTSRAGAVGSSGALCGLVGAVLVVVLLHRGQLGERLYMAWRRHLASIVIITLLISMAPRVSWGGHLGGAVAGLAAGILLFEQRFGTAAVRWASALGVALVAPVCLSVLLWSGAVGPPEADEFERRLLPAINEAVTLAGVIEQDARRQDMVTPRVAKDMVAKLQLLQQRLEATRREVNDHGPYRTDLVESARQSGLELLDAHLRYANLWERRFGAGPDWAQTDQADLERAKERLADVSRRWRAFFQ
jgi:membrane associated rhomboid family serine protease